jgi:hypothetical protein
MGEIKLLRLRYADTCECGDVLDKGEPAGWDRATRQVVCLSCMDSLAEPAVAEGGTPGDSLAREYERRRASRERRVRAMHPRMGGLLLAIVPDPDSTRAFAIGAEGEQELASRLRKKCPNVLFLHNRRLGLGERLGDIDHIAVAPSGVFIIDTKNYHNAKVRVTRSGLLRGAEKLIIRGRNRTKLVDSLKKQQAGVEQALESSHVPTRVRAMFCFLDSDLPWGENQSIQGLLIRGGRRTAKILNTPGDLTADRRRDIWKHLAKMLPSA